MPSNAALDIVDKIFGDQKAQAIDATNDAIAATTYDMIQAKKLEFAKQMGFDLDDTAQAAADEVDKSIDAEPEVTDVDTSGVRLPEDPPEEEAPGTPSSVEASAETETEVNQEEEPEDETDS